MHFVNQVLNNILIPLFNNDENFADVEKLVHVVKFFKADLHLLHINVNRSQHPLQKARLLFSQKRKVIDEAGLIKLQIERLKKLYPFLSIKHEHFNTRNCNELKQYCSLHDIGLVLFAERGNLFSAKNGENKNAHAYFDKINCPVLSVHLHAPEKDIKNIVIPIGNFLPVRSLVLATYIARQFNSKIHLIALNKKFLYHGHDEAVCLYKAYHLLHDNTDLQIECGTLAGSDIRDASFRYAEEINAEMVLLNPTKNYVHEDIEN